MKNKVVACFGIKYEPQWLVDELLENLSPFVDDFAILDDRGRTDELWRDERDYRMLLREKAFKLGADWILWTSPDERWCDNAKKVIPRLINETKDVVYAFRLREMYDPFHYRVDGIWGQKKRPRLYRLKEGQEMGTNPIQTRSYPLEYPRVLINEVNIYHLKHIEPENRVTRSQVFKATDPENKYQRIGYDYLADETNMRLRKITTRYTPFYTQPYIFSPPENLYNGNKNQKNI